MASTEGWSLAWPFTEGVQSDVDLPAMVKTHSGVLFRVAYSVLRSQPEAEDVVQEVFIRVLEHRLSLSGVRNMRVWLVRIAWNLALDRKRRIQPQQLDDNFVQTLVARNTPADLALVQNQQMKAVLVELERLPKLERSVLLLSAIDELSTFEIAEVLSRSESAVRALLSRARQRLRQRIDERQRKR